MRCGRDYINKHVSRYRVDNSNAQITWIDGQSGYFIDEHGSRVLVHSKEETAIVVTCRHIVISMTMGSGRFVVSDCITVIPEHINNVIPRDNIPVGVVTSAMTRRERAIHIAPHIRACNPRLNLVAFMQYGIKSRRDCSGVLPMRPTIPYVHGIVHESRYAVLIGAPEHTRTRTRGRICACVLLVWSPVHRFSRRIRVRGQLRRTYIGNILINGGGLSIFDSHIHVDRM